MGKYEKLEDRIKVLEQWIQLNEDEIFKTIKPKQEACKTCEWERLKKEGLSSHCFTCMEKGLYKGYDKKLAKSCLELAREYFYEIIKDTYGKMIRTTKLKDLYEKAIDDYVERLTEYNMEITFKDKEIEQLQQQIDEMKCCGNCKNIKHDEDYYCDIDNNYMLPHEKCKNWEPK